MGNYVLRRLIGAIPLLLVVSVAVFALLKAAPGGPTGAYMYRSAGLDPQAIYDMEERLGLHDPIYVQYWKWLSRVLHGDLGQSSKTKEPVTTAIGNVLPNTLVLMATAWLVPLYWLGLILILVFYLTLNNPFTGEPLLPAGVIKTLGEDFSLWDRITHLILPVTMLAAGWVAWYSRFLRASMLEVIHQDYVRTARAKGVRERMVVLRHAFRNAAIPLVTLMALDLPFLFSGAVFTEVIFSWPGMGRLFYDAAELRDYGVLMAIIMVTSALIVLSNLLADLIYAFLDPRIRYS